jgi:tRNA1(Val) A37 N6-methylase TrmN6
VFAESDLTRDGFLDGRLSVCQPRNGYRAGVDPVLLAAAVTAVAGQSILELGCGVGVASLCLARRVPGLVMTGVEIQPDYAELARSNATDNGVALTVCDADVASLPPELRAQNYDHVIANPPYFEAAKRSSAIDAGRELALAGSTPLAEWFDCAARRLAPRGYLTMIQNADRLRDMLVSMDHRLGSIIVQPIAPRRNRAAHLVIVQARKNGRAALILNAPIVLHEGDAHTVDGDSYTPMIREVLRNGAPLFLRR